MPMRRVMVFRNDISMSSGIGGIISSPRFPDSALWSANRAEVSRVAENFPVLSREFKTGDIRHDRAEEFVVFHSWIRTSVPGWTALNRSISSALCMRIQPLDPGTP